MSTYRSTSDEDILTVRSAYGASISYISADATACAASPQILGDAVIASNVEFTVMTDKVCNGDCGFVRPGSVAYRELLSCLAKGYYTNKTVCRWI